MTVITQENIQFVISIVTLGGIVFAIFKFFRDPDIKANEKISLLKQKCDMRYDGIGNSIKTLQKDYTLLKENHIRHIESDISDIKNTQTKILTILEERQLQK